MESGLNHSYILHGNLYIIVILNKFCSLNETEDELHFVFRYHLYTQERNVSLLNINMLEFPSEILLIQYLMNTKCRKLAINLFNMHTQKEDGLFINHKYFLNREDIHGADKPRAYIRKFSFLYVIINYL